MFAIPILIELQFLRHLLIPIVGVELSIGRSILRSIPMYYTEMSIPRVFEALFIANAN